MRTFRTPMTMDEVVASVAIEDEKGHALYRCPLCRTQVLVALEEPDEDGTMTLIESWFCGCPHNRLEYVILTKAEIELIVNARPDDGS